MNSLAQRRKPREIKRGHMLIQEMTPDLSIAFLKGIHIGRIACSEGPQAYVTPFFFAYHGDFIYSFSTFGKKISWMRANPLVCVEVDDIISRAEWRTVVVFGRYEELTDASEYREAQVLAHDLLAKAASWWEPGYARTLIGGTERVLDPVYFRVSIKEISGHYATPDRDS